MTYKCHSLTMRAAVHARIILVWEKMWIMMTKLDGALLNSINGSW